MDQKWDRIKQFSTGDACPSTKSLLDSAEMLYTGDRKRSVKNNRHYEEQQQHQLQQQQEHKQVNHSTLNSLEQSIYTAIDEQRFAFESLVKSNTQKLNHIADDVFAELRSCREMREEMERRLTADVGPKDKVDSRLTARKQYLNERQSDLRNQEISLKRDIESSRAAIEMLVLVGGMNVEYMDPKVQKLIDIRQDSIDRVDKELYGIEGQLEEIQRELATLAPPLLTKKPSRVGHSPPNNIPMPLQGQAF